MMCNTRSFPLVHRIGRSRSVSSVVKHLIENLDLEPLFFTVSGENNDLPFVFSVGIHFDWIFESFFCLIMNWSKCLWIGWRCYRFEKEELASPDG